MRARCFRIPSLCLVTLSFAACAAPADDAPPPETSAPDEAALFGLGGETTLTAWNSRASYSRIATNARGDAIVVWAARPALGNGARSIDYAYRPAGGRWSVGKRLATLSVGAVFPSVRLGDRGDAVVVWPAIDMTGLYAVTGTPATGTWTAPTKVSQNPEGTFVGQLVPGLSLDANGDALATYSQLNTIYSVRYDAASARWGAPSPLPESTDAASLQVLPSGDAFVWGSAPDASSEWVAVAYELPAGGSAWLPVHTSKPGFAPSWFAPSCGGKRVFVGKAFEGASWNAPAHFLAVRLVDPADGTEVEHRLTPALDRRATRGNHPHEETAICEPNGDVTVLYSATAGAEPSRIVATATFRAREQAWSTPTTLADGGVALALHASPGGALAAQWLLPRTGSQPLQVRFKPAGAAAWGGLQSPSDFFAWGSGGAFVSETKYIAHWETSFDGAGFFGGAAYAKVLDVR